MYTCWKCLKTYEWKQLIRATGKNVPKDTNWKMCPTEKCRSKTFLKSS